MPVENGVAPAGPSASVPVLSAAGGLMGQPSLGGGGFDLHGALPMLPSPAPGLLGPALGFVGAADQAAAIGPQAAPANGSPASAKAQPGHPFELTPALPGKPSPGRTPLAISRDRRAAPSSPSDGHAAAGGQKEAAASLNELALPEKAAGSGRSFFDLSGGERRGDVGDPASNAAPSASVAAAVLDGGAFGPASSIGAHGRSARETNAALGAGRSAAGAGSIEVLGGENLRDAVASPQALLPPSGAVKLFGAAAPNGDAAAQAGVAAFGPLPTAPRPLALDLSRTGLIVRVRSALSGVFFAPPKSSVKAVVPGFAAPGPSTALLERGGMLEAFSVARVYAEGVSGKTPVAALDAPSAAALAPAPARVVPLSPASEPAPAPLWWAWFALPLFIAAFRAL